MVEYIKDFDKEVKENKGVTIVDFTASWCGPCQMFAPVIEATSNKISDVLFKKLDVDSQGVVAQKYGIMSVPTIVAFKDGEEADRRNGYMNEIEFTKWVESLK